MQHPQATEGTEGEAQRYRTLLEVNNAVISNLTREPLFHAIAQALRRVFPVDRTAIFLHDPARDVLRLFMLESSLPSSYFHVDLEMPSEESHVGWVFQHQRPLLRRDLERERQYPMEDRAFDDGVRSYVIVPLIARGKPIGTLAVASTRTHQYSESDAGFLQEAANQIALAVENMTAYEKLEREGALRRHAEAMLRSIMEGTAAVTGFDFFHSLVRHLAAALQVRYAFLAECVDQEYRRVRTLAFWRGDDFGENFEFDLPGTPCQGVVEGAVSCYARNLQALFPEDRVLADLEAESYLGIPMRDSSGRVIGHLAVLDDKPLDEDPRRTSVVGIFAARAGAELERKHAEEALRIAHLEVERLKNRLQAENVYLQEEIRREHDFVEMVGSSPALLAALRKVEQVAPTDSTVLLSGETGTGKELIARAVHNRSARKVRPLVKVNCSAISGGLVESELFGHVKGAFTGAIERRVGRFELADGGTIFLDEVGELPLETQVKLLRVLQEGEFEAVGSSKTVRVDVRVIAATNRDLEEAVRAGRFRSDLFYRLNVFPLKVPPLRERRSDIPQLVMFFLSRFSKRFGKGIETVSQETLDRLTGYPWPGNVRELQNVIERAAILSQEPCLRLGPDFLPAEGSEHPPRAGVGGDGSDPGALPGSGGGSPPGPLTLEEVERRHILAVLEQTGGVVEGARGAARILNLHPNTLRSRMKKLGIRRPSHEIS
ncbi:MAG: sigma 54-interacting transcriptional regulator [candidate division NC10 bacterium]|nr:sigma 54-interacting transcriptional regulator [candidate division NC10 bacterium]